MAPVPFLSESLSLSLVMASKKDSAAGTKELYMTAGSGCEEIIAVSST